MFGIFGICPMPGIAYGIDGAAPRGGGDDARARGLDDFFAADFVPACLAVLVAI
jgi:hypothetical protein